MPHIIRKQVIELNMDKSLNYFHIQELISRQYWKLVLPALQKEFDSLDEDNEVIEVEHLVIDLGILTEKSIRQEEWAREVPAILAKILDRLRIPGMPGITAIRRPGHMNVFRQWIFYMQNGYLHWSTLKTDRIWYQRVLEALALEIESVRELRELILKDPAVISRIVFQHPDSFLISLVETITARKHDFLRSVLEAQDFVAEPGASLRIPKTRPAGIRFRNRIWYRILGIIAVNPMVSDELIRSETGTILRGRVTAGGDLLETSTDIPAINGLPGVLMKASVRQAEKQVYGTAIPGIRSLVDEEGIYVRHAGVVLLHPFLNNLFKRLRLLTGRKFTNRAAQLKALYLIHYLATGNVMADEYELVIARVLCAWSLQEPVEPGIRLSKKALGEAEDLLAAAIQQWEILKHTSPDGLREGFLQRNGKLFTRHDNLYLQVETSTIDILLDHLPWNLSMLKLPWMDNILRVEWR